MAERALNAVPGGHLIAHVAACRGGVGVARIEKLRLLDVRGAESDLLEIAQQLVGRLPDRGRCVRMRGGWWQTLTAHRALLLADPAQREGFDRLVEIAIALRPDVAVDDASDSHAGLVLAGPAAERLAGSSAARETAPVLVAADGVHHQVLVVPARRADAARHVLLDAGRRVGAVAVDARATDLYRAAMRAAAGRPRPTPSLLLSPIPTQARQES